MHFSQLIQTLQHTDCPKSFPRPFFFLIQELSRMWSWTSIEQQTLKSTFATALPNIANALFFILGGDFSEGSIACHFHVGAAFPKYFLAAWFSVKFCGTSCCRKCHSLLPWEKTPHLAYIYLPFLFAILLKAAVAIFSPCIHLKSSNSLLLKCIVSTVSASIATKLLPHTSSFSGAWRQTMDTILGRGK